MFQHDNAWPHVTRIHTQFLEAENVPVLPWPAYSPDMSPIKHVYDALDQRIQKGVPVPANIKQFCTAIEEEWDNQQADQLFAKEMCRAADTDRLSDPCYCLFLTNRCMSVFPVM